MKLIEKNEQLFRDLKFEKELINDTFVFVCNEKYRKVTFIKKLESFVIEYADSYEEAEKMYMKTEIYTQYL